MARSFEDKYAACPYFTRYDNARIHCEGFPDEASAVVITVFECGADRRRYSEQYCNSVYRACKLFQIVDSKYKG